MGACNSCSCTKAPEEAQVVDFEPEITEGNDKSVVKKGGKKNMTIVILGLDGAGKTTIGNNFSGKPDKDVFPTWGFEISNVEHDGHKIRLFGLGGGKGIRGYWNNYYDEVHGLIFVVDSNDNARLKEVKEEFQKMSVTDRVLGKPILIYANKQDLPSALSEVEISDSLNLSDLHTSPHNILKTIAKPSGDEKKPAPDQRIMQGLSWLLQKIDDNYDTLQTQVKKDVKLRKEKEKLQRAAARERVAAAKAERERKEAEKKKMEEEKHETDSAPIAQKSPRLDKLTVSQNGTGEVVEIVEDPEKDMPSEMSIPDKVGRQPENRTDTPPPTFTMRGKGNKLPPLGEGLNNIVLPDGGKASKLPPLEEYGDNATPDKLNGVGKIMYPVTPDASLAGNKMTFGSKPITPSSGMPGIMAAEPLKFPDPVKE